MKPAALRINVIAVALVLATANQLQAQSGNTNIAWAKRIASTEHPDNELAIGMAIDSAANIYVTGWFDRTNDFGGITLTNSSGGGQDIFVGKYNSAGELQWARRAGGNTAEWDVGRGIGVDASGNVYVTGGFSGTADFGQLTRTASQFRDFFLAKYDSSGTVQWVRQNDIGSGHTAYGSGMAVDGNGNSYIVGYIDGDNVILDGITLLNAAVNNPDESMGYNSFLVKYNAAGAVQWARPFSSPGMTYATSVAVDASGSVYVAGSFSIAMSVGATNFTSAGGKDGFVAKFNNAGTLQWARHMSGPSDDGGLGATAVDATGNVYVVGGFGNAAGDIISFGSGITLTNLGGGFPGAGVGDAFLAKYNSVGTIQWARRAGGIGLDAYTGVTTDGLGNIYVGGGTGDTGLNAVLAKYDSSGVVQWTQASTGSDFALAWAGPVLDAATNCYLAGWFQSNVVFGTNVLTGEGYWDFFLARIGTNAGAANNAPVIAAHPQSRTNLVGTTATLTVGMTTTNSFVYQWRKDGTNLLNGGNLSGVTTTNLTLSNVQFSNAGNYTVVITNTYGSVTSSVATVTVIANVPVITRQPQSATNFLGSPVTFSVAATGSDPLVYQWRKDGTTLVDGGNLSGVTTTNLTLSNVQLTDAGNYTVVITNPSGSVTSSVATLTVIDNSYLDYGYLTNDGTITITGYTGPGGALTLPSTIAGRPVVAIDANAFGLNYSVTSISIPAGLTNIAPFTFSACMLLSDITVAALNPVYRSVAGVLFDQAQTLLIQFPPNHGTSYVVPSSVIFIGDVAFAYCGLESISFPAGLASIGEDAFWGCGSLTNVTMPASVTNIGNQAFYGCAGLTSVTLPDGLSSIGSAPFDGCTGLTNITVAPLNSAYKSVNGVLFDAGLTRLIQYPVGRSGGYAVPSTVQHIGYDSFAGCAGLTSVVLPGGVTEIDAGAFWACTSLTNITIPSSVGWIGDFAFGGCAALEGVYFNGAAPLLDGAYVFFDDLKATAYYLPGTTGWEQWVNPPPAVLWNPVAQTGAPSFGVKTNRFGFNITGTANIPIVVEANTNLTGPVWVTLLSGTLTNGAIYFSDPQWTNYPGRYYRLRSP